VSPYTALPADSSSSPQEDGLSWASTFNNNGLRSEDSSSSSSFRRNLLLGKKSSYGDENQNQHNQNEYYASEDGGADWHNDNANYDDDHHRYSYFQQTGDDDEESLSSPFKQSKSSQTPVALRYRSRQQQTQNGKQYQTNNLAPSSKFRAALLRNNDNNNNNRNLERQRQQQRQKQGNASFKKHTLFFRGDAEDQDDSVEEIDEFGLRTHYDDEEDPHLHQERYKSSSSHNLEHDESPVQDQHIDDALHDDEASDEFGRYSLANSYFDNEYSLSMLHKMECVTPTKSTGEKESLIII
jgi:hypothetical protein